jgi:Holliday junction resolvase RusA-like endonuclease
MFITLPLELHSSKNGQQIIYNKRLERMMVIKKAVARQQDSQLKILLMANKRTWDKMVTDKSFPLKVGFYVYRKTRRRFDWVNIVQGLQDAMVKNGYLPDDSANYLTPVFLGWDVDSQNPRVEVSVL